MSNYVLKYKKGEEVKYLSHLDFVRMFHRTVRRSGLPMSFSQGFNPHPIMTVAMPLSVGVTSDCEYMKIGFDGDFSGEEIKNKLNNAFPKGFKILAAVKTEGKEHDFNKLDRAEYLIEAELEKPYVPDIEDFMANEKILVMKKSKSGIKEADIKPYIYKLRIKEAKDNIILFDMIIAAGNNYNLKPETVLDAIKNYQPEFNPVFSMSRRTLVLAGDKELIKG